MSAAFSAALLVGAAAGSAGAQPGVQAAAPSKRPRAEAPQLERSGRAAALVSRAREHFERGRAAYREGQLKQALAEFERAYRLAPSPELEFNLARVYERMGDAEPAIRRYLGYLTDDDVAPAERAQIEARIRTLQALLARQKAQVETKAPSSDALTAEARAFFERGLALFRRRQYRAALEAFAAARRFVPLPELAYNLALTCERLDRPGDAVAHYRAYLREAKAPPDEAAVRARIKALLSERTSGATTGR